MHKAYKTELKPNNKQLTYLRKSCGTARFVYNWGLDYIKTQRAAGEKYAGKYGVANAFRKIKKEQYPWVTEVSNRVSENAIHNVDSALKNFWRGLKTGKKVGFPRFKSRHRSKSTFKINGDKLKVTDTHVRLPKLPCIRLKETGYIPSDIKLVSGAVSFDGINKSFQKNKKCKATYNSQPD